MKNNSTLLLLSVALYASPLAAQCPASVDAGPDIYVCTPPAPAKVQLNGSVSGQFSFAWLPSVPAAIAKTLDPTVTLSQTTTYILTADGLDPNAPNLVVNGDFEQGATGFSSELSYAPGNMGSPLNTYDVMAFDPPYMPKHDHTTGDGNLFAAMLSKTPQPVTVWCQTIPVVPGKTYEMEFFTIHPYPYVPAHNRALVFMDGLLTYTGTWDATGNWVRHHLLWKNGPQASVEMCIVHDEHIKFPAVIALDDISLRPACTATDSVTVHLTKLNIAPPANYTLICPGALLTLDATANTSSGDKITYNWETQDGNIVSSENTLTPVVDAAGMYTLKVQYESGTHTCDLKTEFLVKSLPLPQATITPAAALDCLHPQTTLVGLIANMPGGLTYQWAAANGGHIVSDPTFKSITVNQGGLYQLIATNPATGCTVTAEYVLAPPPAPPAANATCTHISPAYPIAGLSGAGSSKGSNIIYAWTTSDGNIVSGQNALSATASKSGNYILTVKNIATGCIAVDTTIVLALSNGCPLVIDAGPDIYACVPPGPAAIQLKADLPSNVTTFDWLPPVPPSVPEVPDPAFTVSAPVSTFVLEAKGIDYETNMIANGDFEQGNSDFTSGAIYSPGQLKDPSTYDIVSNPQDVNSEFTDCPDHTSGAGNMMVVRPDPENALTVWCQTVTVQPNMLYYVSCFIARVTSVGLSLNRYKILMDGILIGQNSGFNSACTWAELKAPWESGTNTSVEVCIEVEPIHPPSHIKYMVPFALDDITMHPTCKAVDSVKVFVKTLSIAPSANLTVPCAGSPIAINATNGTSLGDHITFGWSTPNGNIVSGANTLTPTIDQAGSYWLDLNFESTTHACSLKTGFVAKEAPELLVNVLQTKPLTCFAPTVPLQALPNFTQDLAYTWATDEGNIISGASTAIATVNQPGTYTVTITNTKTGCSATAERTVDPPAPPPLATATSTNITPFSPIAGLSGVGSSTGPNIIYAWTTPDGNIVSGQKSLSATASQPGTYILTVRDATTGCTAVDTTIVLMANSQCPVTVDAGPDIYACTPPGPATIQLNAQMSGTPISFEWLPPVPSHLKKTLDPAFTVNSPVSTFVFTSTALDYSNNLIFNGDFEFGNTTFATSLSYSPGDLTPPNTYDVLANPQDDNPAYSACTDHTTGQGNMLAAHPILEGIQAVWSQTVTVSPNTRYYLSFFATRLTTGAPSNNKFRLLMNGSLIAEPVAYFGNCTWTEVAATWDSGNNTSVEVAIEVSSVFGQGHIKQLQAFGLDDITMYGPCTAVDSVKVFVKALTIAPLTNLAVPCAGASITLNATNGTSIGDFITHEWSTSDGNFVSGTNTFSPTVDQAGTYWLNLHYESSTHTCDLKNSIVVAEQPPLTSTILQPKPLSCFNSMVALQALTNFPTDIAYAWDAGSGGNIISGASTAIVTVNQPGTYTVTVTNTQTGCTVIAEQEVNPPEPPPVASATSTNISSSNPIAGLNGVGSSTGSNIIYAWTTPDGNIVSGQNALSATASKPGTYILTVRDVTTGCTAVDTTIVLMASSSYCPPDIDAGTDIYACSTNGVASIQLDASVPPHVNYFEWLPPVPIIFPPVLDPAFTVTATMSAFVLKTRAIDYDNNLIINGDFEQGNTAFTSGASYSPGSLTQPYTYDILTNPQDANPTFAPCSDHTTGSGNMMAIVPHMTETSITTVWCQTLTVQPNMDYYFQAFHAKIDTVAAATIQFKVYMDGLLLQTSGGISVTYPTCEWRQMTGKWYSGSQTSVELCIELNSIVLPGHNKFPSPVALDDISLYPTCWAYDTVKAFVNHLTIAPPANYTIPCAGSPITLNATSGTSPLGPHVTYQWSTPDGNIVSGANTLTPTVDQPGTYLLDLQFQSSTHSCVLQSSFVVTEAPAALAVNIQQPKPLTCNSPAIALKATPNFPDDIAYAWASAVGGNIVSGANTATATVNQPGTYTVTITNTKTGCTATTERTVAPPEPPPTAIATATAITCAQSQAALSGTGSSSGSSIFYLWTTANGTITSPPASLNATASSPGTYVLQVLNTTDGCKSFDTVQVVSNLAKPALTLAAPGVLVCKKPDTIALAATVLPANAALAWAAANGGNIVSGAATAAPKVSATGTYTLTATDPANGCTSTASVTVQSTINLNAVAAPTPPLTCDQASLMLNATGSSAGPGIQYLWTTTGGLILSGNTTLAPTIAAPGTYHLLVTDTASGCSKTLDIKILAEKTAPLAEAAPAPYLFCGKDEDIISAIRLDTLPNVAIQWTTTDGSILAGADSLAATVNAGGTYTLTLTNLDNGCTTALAVPVVADFRLPEVQIAAPAALTCTTLSLDLNSTATSASGQIAYDWFATGGGHIVSGAMTAAPTIDQPGTYTIIVWDDANGCSATAFVTVALDRQPPALNIAPAPALTCAVTALNLSATTSGGNPQYAWAASGGGNIVSGAATAAPKIDQSGTYALTVTDLTNGCTATGETTVSANKNAPQAEAGPSLDLDCTTASAALGGSGSTGPNFTYSWTATNGGNIVSGENTLAPVVNAAGTYILQVLDNQNGCTATDLALVQKDANVPTAQIQPPATLDCLTPTVQLDALGTSQGADITFVWMTPDGNFLSGQNSLHPIVDAPGQYTIEVLNTTSNCSVSATVTVPENRDLPLAQVAPTAPLTCLTTSLSLDASGSSQGAGYDLTWTVSGGGHIASGGNTLAPTVDQPGTYALLITDPSNGCTAAASVTVTANTAAPQADAGPSSMLDCATASLVLSGSGSTGPQFSYAWTTSNGTILAGANTLTPTVSAAGTYTLQIVDSQNNCAAMDTVLVEKNADVPTALAQTPGLLTCQTTALQLTASGTSQGTDFTYLWTAAGGGNIVSGNTTLSPTVNQPGTYNLLVTNTATGCSAIASVPVGADRNLPTAAAAAPTVLDCKTLTVALSGAGSSTGSPFAYDWTSAGGGGSFVSGKNTLAPVVNQPGTYALLVTNLDNGCTATATAAVLLDKTAPAIQVAPASQLNCTVNTLTINASGTAQGANIAYGWTASNGGNILSGNTGLAPTIDQPGTYTLLVTNAANGCTATASVTVSRDVQPPTTAIASPASLTCDLTALPLDGNGSSQGANFTYGWTATGGGNIVSGNTGLTPVVNQPGTYNLLITNTQNTCTTTASVAVTQDLAKPQVSTLVPSALDCATQSLSLSAVVTDAGSNFQTTWTTANGLILSGANTLTPTVGAAGTYMVLVKNLSNGCTQTASAQVLSDQMLPLSAAAAPTELTCKTLQVPLSGAGSSTGSSFAYDWTAAAGGGSFVSGKNTLAPVVNQPGTYTLLVTNTDNHCTATATVTVLRNIQPPQATAQSSGLLTCTTTQTALTGNGSGGTSGIAYAWAGPGIVSGANTAAPTVNLPGVYTLTVSDLYNGCASTAQVTVGQNVTPPISSITPPAGLDCLVKTLPLSGSVTAPASGYSVAWTGAGIVSGANTLAPMVNQPGIYTLLVTNLANGCTATATTSVSQNIQPPVAQASGGFELNCTVLQGVLSAAGSSAGANFQYVWATASGGGNIVSGGNSAAPLVDAPGLYTLTVSDLKNGCTAESQVSVTHDPNFPTAMTLAQLPPNCQRPTGSVQVMAVAGGTGPYLYSLDGGTTFGSASQFNKVAPGAYTLVVQDANGCQHEQPLTFDAPVKPMVALGPDLRLTFGEDSTLTAVVNLPLDQIASVTWSPMESLTLTADPLVVIAKPLRSTFYTVTVLNKDGCEAKVSLRAQVDDPHLWVPNVFSPGRRDGVNDWFLIFASDNSVQIIKTLQIFDRWGTMVFRNDDLQPNVEKMGWDGSFRGQTMQPAVFAWYAEVMLANGELVVLKGDVTVVD